MLPIQPPLIPAFFSKATTSVGEKNIGQKVNKQFYLSWEDALWQLLQVHKVAENSTVLVPEFFCGDVIDNMQAHGLTYKTYAVDRYLQPSESDFILKLKKYKPAVTIIFHAVGITNQLLKNSKNWLEFLPKNTILIEDCVHRVIDQENIRFITESHYIIDSLRKVVPLQGSWVYSTKPIPKVSTKTSFLTAWYKFKVFFLWLVMQLFLSIVYYTQNSTIQKYGNRAAEYMMKFGYDVIGDHKLPASGILGMAWLSSKIDIEKIYKKKIEQVDLYKKLLGLLFNSKYFFEIPFLEPDYSQLRGFPLGVNLETAEQFLEYVRSQNLLLRFELNDSVWSEKQKIIYLPMGLHVTKEDIEWVCKVIASYNKPYVHRSLETK